MIVKSVKRHSPLKNILKRGDEIVAFDKHKAIDNLDYMYYDSQEKFDLTYKRDGKEETVAIEKSPMDEMDVEFVEEEQKMTLCKNKCMFCFVDQMPKGMRESLYVKDDDYESSFLNGSFVTLTNASEEDLERIVRLNLSPLYVSVHTTNGELRKKMMKNPNSDKILSQIEYLANNGITINAQIVLVRGVNDGFELEYTINDLFKFYPMVNSVAVVPCGITKYRENLPYIPDIDSDYAREIVKYIKEKNELLRASFAFAADEFYFRGGLPLEKYDYYGEFLQLENGVGMAVKFMRDLDDSLEYRELNKKTHLLIITGKSIKSTITRAARKVEEKVKNLRVSVISAKNNFFGETVTCSGLLVGADVLTAAKEFSENQVKRFDYDYDELVITACMLRSGTDKFLDDMTVGQLSHKLGKKVRVTDGGGADFFSTLSFR